MQNRLLPTLKVVFEPHDALVAFLARHQLSNHRAVLLVDRGLVDVRTTHVRLLIAVVMLGGAGDFRQLEIALTTVIVRPNLALHVGVGQHRVIEGHSTLLGVALPLILVVVYAVDVDDAFVVVADARWTANLDEARVASSLNLLTVATAKQNLLLDRDGVLRAAVASDLVSRRRVSQHALLGKRRSG